MRGVVDASAGVFVAIDGAPVDLSKVDWYMRAPCSCISGVTVGFCDYGPPPALLVATAEQAMRQFHESKAEREKYERLGFTVFPDLRSKVHEYLTMQCLHEPKWGYEKPPRPEGMSWAVGGYHGERTSTLHLVATESVRTYEFDPDRDHWTATSLCGTEKRHWSAEDHATDGLVECSRCTKKAVTP